MEPNTAIIALGSNLGDSGQIILDAFAKLENLSASAITKSSLWKTAPVDCPPGSPDFVNAVAIISPLRNETPETLLTKLQQLEKEFGRQPKKILNEARPLDLDLIVFGDETRDSNFLKLPHPRAHRREFVLRPLTEIAPDMILPGQNKKVSELLQALGSSEAVLLSSSE